MIYIFTIISIRAIITCDKDTSSSQNLLSCSRQLIAQVYTSSEDFVSPLILLFKKANKIVYASKD